MSKKNYRPEIDGLRALAVVAVIVNHFNKDLLPSGYLGVDIFFVISGFVITASLAHRESLSFQSFITGFYARRVKRLVPALIFCVALTALATCLVNPFPNVSVNTGVTSLVGLSNLYLLRQATDYFGSSAELNTFTQTWSLGVEEQFYFLFPFMVWLTGFSRHTKSGARNLLMLMTVFVVSSFCLYVYLSGHNPSAAYFLMPSRLWEMGSGCLLFLCLAKMPLPAWLFRWLKPELLIGLIIAAFFLPLSFQVLATVGIVCLTSLLIALIKPATSAYRLLTLKPALFIGLISYSLYLWHWSVLSLSRWTIGIHWWSVPFQLGLMFLLAFLSYRYIESPLRHLCWSPTKFGDIKYALSASLLCAVLVFASARQYSDVAYVGDRNLSVFGAQTSHLIAASSDDANWQTALLNAETSMRECNMTPHHLRGNDYQASPIVDEVFVADCLATEGPKLVLLGDSFAGVIGKHAAYAAHELGYEFTFLNGYHCPYPLDTYGQTLSAKQSQCEIDPQFLQRTVVGSLNSGDIVMLRLYFSNPVYLRLDEQNWQSALAFYDNELNALHEKVKQKGASLLVVGANATAVIPPDCQFQKRFNYPSRDQAMCESTTIDMGAERVNRFAIEHNQHLAQVLNNANDETLSFIDPMAYLCSEDLTACLLTEEGTPLMTDDQHLAEATVDKVYPTLVSTLKQLSLNSLNVTLDSAERSTLLN